MDDAAWQQALAGLRAAGAATGDPVRRHYLEALARRAGDAPAHLRPVLRQRMEHALAPCREPRQQAPANTAGHPLPGAPTRPLAALVAHIEAARHAADADAPPGGDGRGLRAAHRFMESWALASAAHEVDAAIGRGPENAGPLNSHNLVLQTLRLMRELSPDYLRRFLAQADTLLWLEQVQARRPVAGKPPAARARKRKARV